MTFIERGKTESLAEHLLRNADVLGADAGQRAQLIHAFRLSVRTSRADRVEGGRIAAQVRDELQASLDQVLLALAGRGEKVSTYNDAGAKRVKSRDGLGMLVEGGALTEAQAKAGMAYRMCAEAATAGLGSVLGHIGEGGGGGGGRAAEFARRSAAELHRAYVMARLNQMERAVGAVMEDGRELNALRLIAGEGQTVRAVAGSSGHARDAYKAALVRSLNAIAEALRITGQ